MSRWIYPSSPHSAHPPTRNFPSPHLLTQNFVRSVRQYFCLVRIVIISKIDSMLIFAVLITHHNGQLIGCTRQMFDKFFYERPCIRCPESCDSTLCTTFCLVWLCESWNCVTRGRFSGVCGVDFSVWWFGLNNVRKTSFLSFSGGGEISLLCNTS